MKSLLLLVFFAQSFLSVSFAKTKKKSSSKIVKTNDKKFFVELQSKNMKNQERAKDLGDEWNFDNPVLLYGSAALDFSILKEHNFDGSVFFRHSNSKLNELDAPGLNYLHTPRAIVTRDLVKMYYRNEEGESDTYIVLNNFVYEWGDKELKFKAGRMIIDYGEGYTINPINPFKYNLAITNIQDVHQASDGFKFEISKDPKLKLHIFMLGDKAYTDYDEEITRTIFLWGEWQYKKDLKINYVLGEDQKRHKYGIEVKENFDRTAMRFIQVMKYSQNLEKDDADDKGQFHYVAGYEDEMMEQWRARLEVGKFQRDDGVSLGDNANHIPFEGFWGMHHFLTFTDKLGLELRFIADSFSRASYYNSVLEYKYNDKYSIRAFSGGILSSADKDGEYAAQFYIPQETGVALRGTF